jgi:GTP cyclohydrolase I
MNVHPSEMKPAPDRDEAKEALALLRSWARAASPEEVADLDPAIARLLPSGEVSNYPVLAREYPEDFATSAAYLASLPDLQNGPAWTRARRASTCPGSCAVSTSTRKRRSAPM